MAEKIPSTRELDFGKQDSFQIKWQQKFLLSDISLNTTLGDLTFNNLEIGKTYRVIMFAKIGDNQVGASGASVDAMHDGNILGRREHTADDASGPTNTGCSTVTKPFTATATTVTFVTTGFNGTDTIFGNGTTAETNAILEEIPNHVETTQWT